MTKRIIFIFAALCSLQARASVRPAQADTVRYTSFTDAAELLQPVQPTHLDGVILPMRGSGNWFVGIAGGSTAFLGTLLGCEDLFGRIETSYSLAVGKWFTPSVGARINYSGSRFKDARLSTQRYHYVHADLLWNVLGRGYARQEQVRWGLVPFAGIGLLHHATNGHNPFAVSYGVQGQYRISRRVSAVAELSGTTTFQDFDGYGRANRLGDHMLSLTAGFTFHIGKTGWKRAVDAAPYIRRSERLAEYVDFLSEENRRYAGRHDCDRRTLAELKKILEIEGLLDAYGHILQEDGEVGKDYPVNNYSGLNSLRARLKNRQWDGTSPLDTTEVRPGGGSVSVRVEAGSANSRYGCNARRDCGFRRFPAGRRRMYRRSRLFLFQPQYGPFDRPLPVGQSRRTGTSCNEIRSDGEGYGSGRQCDRNSRYQRRPECFESRLYSLGAEQAGITVRQDHQDR